MGAHRAMAGLVFGWEVIEGMVVCHHCDNPPCCNPAHLFVGEHVDNVRDMIEKGRQVYVRGEEHGVSKLTAADVRAIRTDRRLQREIAEQYGLAQATVSKIKRRQRWAHVA